MKEYLASYAKTLLLCLGGFILGRLLIFPGFVDLASPSHDDLYRYFLVSQTSWGVKEWLAPRPLMLLILHGLGSFLKMPNGLWVILSLSSVFFIAALIEFLRWGFIEKIPTLNIVLYTAILFSFPSSWEIHQLDYGGMLSGVLCIVGLSIFIVRVRNKGRADASQFFLPFFIYWAAIETKPTFSALVLAISVLFFAFRRDAISAIATIGVFLISVFVLLKDKYLGSPFLGTDDAGVYAVKINLVDNFSALAAYLDASIPYFLLPGLLLVYGVCLLNKNTRWLGFLVPVLALSAIAPMTLIPNRVLTLYSWYSSIFFLLPLLVVSINGGSSFSASAKKAAFVGFSAVIAGQFLFAANSNPLSAYFYSTSVYNRNVVESLDVLRNGAPAMNGGRVLVSGVQGPFHAFRQQPFVSDRTGIASYWLMLRSSESSWNASARHLGNKVSLEEVALQSFDTFVVYGPSGKIKYILNKESLMRVPVAWRDAVIFCSATINYNEVSSSELDKVMACFDHSGEYMAAVRLGKSKGIPEALGPFGLYHFGNALIKTGDHALARIYLELALSQNDNAHIRAALKSIDALEH